MTAQLSLALLPPAQDAAPPPARALPLPAAEARALPLPLFATALQTPLVKCDVKGCDKRAVCFYHIRLPFCACIHHLRRAQIVFNDKNYATMRETYRCIISEQEWQQEASLCL